ncbi:hypothetical protein F511_04709 [Dorcoceras hygrometricum]|uniref:Triacylglycerol lipase n=1 Tax=Dorcoceras hygrometricum TaxID=472368 RepID=A0A2Z7B0W0_9LAMI|nr:hypothetical protein F511_04709 [Dorcoceras hygrometricum]
MKMGNLIAKGIRPNVQTNYKDLQQDINKRSHKLAQGRQKQLSDNILEKQTDKQGPNQAAANGEHWVVRGPQGGKVITREKVINTGSCSLLNNSNLFRKLGAKEHHQDPPHNKPIIAGDVGMYEESDNGEDDIVMETAWSDNNTQQWGCITDSACKNQLVVVSVQYGPFNTYIPIRSTTIGKSRVAKDPITMHISWRSNSDIASVTRVSTTFRVVRTNQYNQDLGLIHSTNGNHLESSNEGSSIDHQVTIHLHAQNITMFPTNETWYFTSQMLVSSSGGLILILTAQSTRNEFRIHSDY